MAHHHEHNHGAGARELKITLFVTATYMVAEAIGGYLTKSLALLADSGHMLSDIGSLALSLMAMRFAVKPRSSQMTFGYYRAEILAALTNGVTLVVISIVVFYEALQRFSSPPEVQSLPMLIVATIGLLLNLFSAFILSRKKEENLNIHGAFLHVIADTLGSVGAIAAGIIMLLTGWYLADPVISVLIGVLILFSSWRLLKESVTVLMEGTPAHINPEDIFKEIKGVRGVVDIHDFHIWTVTSGFESVSAHVVVEDCETMAEAQEILAKVREVIHEKFAIEHSTIQIEYAGRSMRPDFILPKQTG